MAAALAAGCCRALVHSGQALPVAPDIGDGHLLFPCWYWPSFSLV